MSLGLNMRFAQMGNMGALALAARQIALQPLQVQLPATHDLSTATLVAQPLTIASNDNHVAPRANDVALLDAAALIRASARFLGSDVYVDALTRARTTPISTQVPATPVDRAPKQIGQPAQQQNPAAPQTKLPDAPDVTAQPKQTPIISAALLSDAPALEDIPQAAAHLPQTSRTASVNTPSAKSTDAPQAQPATDTIVPLAMGPMGQTLPYTQERLGHVRAVLSLATTQNSVSRPSPFARNGTVATTAASEGTLVTPQSQISTRRNPMKARQQTRNAAPLFNRPPAAKRGRDIFVSNLKTQSARKAEPAQIVRVATTGTAKRRIVFARVPGTRSEYRLVGIDHEQKPRGHREPAAPHALIAPTAARELPRAVLSLAPRSAGESAYTMPDPRELREDERKALVGMLKEQLALGPASLNDPSIREQFNGLLFSNTVGEMSHYVTADQWNAMVRATVLYAARAVLPFSNNSITQVAASQLFKEAGAQTRYTEWTKHFGITGLGDIALIDTFLADDRILTMPEYFLKGILDHLLENAQELQGYDEDVLPLPFASELHLQWETIAFINDPAITTDAELIDAATSFVEEIAALDTYAAQHFLELVLLSTMIKTDSIKGVWNEDQAIALVASSIEAGMSAVVDPIGENRQHPRRMRRLIAMAKEQVNVAAADNYQAGLDRLTRNMAEAIRNDVFSIDDETEELHANH